MALVTTFLIYLAPALKVFEFSKSLVFGFAHLASIHLKLLINSVVVKLGTTLLTLHEN